MIHPLNEEKLFQMIIDELIKLAMSTFFCPLVWIVFHNHNNKSQMLMAEVIRLMKSSEKCSL